VKYSLTIIGQYSSSVKDLGPKVLETQQKDLRSSEKASKYRKTAKTSVFSI